MVPFHVISGGLTIQFVQFIVICKVRSDAIRLKKFSNEPHDFFMEEK